MNGSQIPWRHIAPDIAELRIAADRSFQPAGADKGSSRQLTYSLIHPKPIWLLETL